MNGSPAVLTYAACGLLIVVYASGRFNTPLSNRSSTRQTLYWWSCAGYVLSALALFAALSILLQAAVWRTALLGRSDEPSLPAPLIATLAMTTLLPSIPLLKRLDEWFLSTFLEWGEIPAEVKRRAAAMTPESFTISREDVAALRQTYGDGSYGDSLSRYLRRRGADGPELSHCRLTRVVKLYDRVRKLAGEQGYGRFFAEAGKEFAELERRVTDFLHRAAASLALDERLGEIENGPVFVELARERREAFAQSSHEIFVELALFLARAVLRSETSERGVVRRLREAGFTAAEPMNLPRFPINSLTVLAIALFLYLGVLILLVGGVVGMEHYDQAGGLMVAAKSAMVRLVTIGVTVWLMQGHRFFRRAPGEPPRFFAYVVNGAIATAAAASICVYTSGRCRSAGCYGRRSPDHPAELSALHRLGTLLRRLGGEYASARLAAPRRGGGMRLGDGRKYGHGPDLFGRQAPLPDRRGLPGWEITMVIGFPTSIAIVFGGCVPHIYRAARRAASIRREEASRSFAADAPLSEQPEAGVHRARAPSASQVASVMREETHSPVVDDAPQRRRPSDRPARRSAESADGSITNDAVSRR